MTKFKKFEKKTAKYIKKLYEKMPNDGNLSDYLVKYIRKIFKLGIRYNILCSSKNGFSNKNHNWVSIKLADIIKSYYADKNSLSNIKIVDIGGGEGDVVLGIANACSIKLSNIYCVENKEAWTEKYKFNNKINYIFWDNKHIDIESNSVDVIILMVVLHHTSDNLMQTILTNVKRILKPGGMVIIKEHHMDSDLTKHLIDWEHHLYSLYNIDNNNITHFITEYVDSYVDNFKTMDYFDNLFDSNGFELVNKLNRKFDTFVSFNSDYGNITKLYWAIYKKID
jgi:ubiquinone/menaquinone biosynthesis C-methylase UbiE